LVALVLFLVLGVVEDEEEGEDDEKPKYLRTFSRTNPLGRFRSPHLVYHRKA
jgi:hypothetical protein